MILQQNYVEKVLEFIAQKEYEKDFGSYLNSISIFLSKLFQVEYVLIDKYSPEKPTILETVSLYSNNSIAKNITYELAHTPCENVLNKSLCCYPTNIQKLFPKDEMLVEMKAESYIGIPLWSAKGKPIGLIAILGVKEIKNVKEIETALQIVAIKAAQVLEKILFEAVFENQINRLKESQENYQHLFNENPISLWEEDFTYGYRKMQELLTLGVKDIQKYYHENPAFFIECISNVKISNVNDASVKLFKAKDKEDLINNIYKIRSENTLIQYEKILGGILKGEKEVIQEVVFKNFSENEVVGIVKVNLFKNNNRNELKAIISISDITERVKSEKALLKSEVKFRNIVENTAEWIWELNTEGKITYSNPVVKKILGYSPEELIGKNNFALISKFDRKRILEIFLEKIEKKEGWINLEISWTHKNGNPRFLESNAIPIIDEEGILTGFRGINSDITERKEAEKALKKSELKYRNIAENTSEWFWEIDINGNFTYSNEIAEQITGYKINELVGQNTFMFIKEHELLKNTLNENIKKNIGWKIFEIEFKHKNGNYYYLESSAIPLYDEEKNLIGYRGVNRDVTERKEAEKEHEKLLTAVEQSANAIIITDTKGNIEYTNPKFTEHTGYTSTEVLGKNPRILNSGKQPKEFFTDLWNTISAGEIWKGTLQNKGKNGKLFWEQTTITPLKNKEGKIINYLAVKENITALRESERNLLNAQKIAQIGTYFLDLKSNLFTSSYIFDKISGFKPKDTKTFDVWRTLTHPEDSNDNQRVLNNCIENGETFDREYRIFTKDTKKLRWIQGLGEITYDKGEPISFAGTIQDITERKNAEIKIKKQNKILKIAKERAEESDRLKTEFLNNMSHEIRTPMNGILGFSQLLSNNDLTIEKRTHFINIIQNSGNQLMRIIDDILEISSLGTKQVKVYETEVCLNDLMLELFSIFDIKAKDLKLPLYYKKGLSDVESTIFTDKLKLNKILNNLLENAFKFTNAGFIEFGYVKKKNNLEIYVKDTGIGIKPEKQELIFERFSQAEKDLSKNVGGLGLGLSIAKENSELLGGKITVESETMKGATFFVTIPYKPVKILSTSKSSNLTLNTNQNNHSILIVEDEEVNYLFLETLIMDSLKINCPILHAKNGEEAVNICRNNQDISLILMDLKMPVMDGCTATGLIKEFLPNIPIIAQTAYSTTEDKKKSIDAGCNDFISKPISKKTLIEVIKNYTNIIL